ncbi:anaphase-promoting complex, subunit 10 [Basidiobolus meristosporus CBS 931.73]|uniref:Anaphase-promoting complex subunit 10 n=1 Tax=Basidiobolus meristosporus CBS 931.73 TaxID=1314790 RepID=A0A1Y1Y416_9FUNG|nr:anaphase-promoting complex, subunit 10 [Basidiobolus meristosporus CBS 931.73]|eukprot:ORX92760.1 anaphase-promoting complex, subunit 10 [Basidiobolus meristosporus CBS 931.73]
MSDNREVGNLAFWSVSSEKMGYGVDKLIDDNVETFWQSDGGHPHFINIQFTKEMTLSQISIYLDYKQDESYTPLRMAFNAGTGTHDLQQVQAIEIGEVVGWVNCPLVSSDKISPFRARYFQVVIYENHQNGKDTHIRQIKLYSPIKPPIEEPDSLEYDTVDFLMHSMIR